MPFLHRTTGRSAWAVAMVAVAVSICNVSGVAAAEPKASQVEFDVDVYSQQGATIGCGLSFLTAWSNNEQQIIAAAGALNFFAADTSSTGSTIKVRATIGNQAKDLKFAWVSVSGVNDTKAFSPLLAEQKGPFFSFFGKPDSRGLSRLTGAAQRGFVLGLSFEGLPLDESVLLPPVPASVLTKLNTCTNAVASRQRALGAK